MKGWESTTEFFIASDRGRPNCRQMNGGPGACAPGPPCVPASVGSHRRQLVFVPSFRWGSSGGRNERVVGDGAVVGRSNCSPTLPLREERDHIVFARKACDMRCGNHGTSFVWTSRWSRLDLHPGRPETDEVRSAVHQTVLQPHQGVRSRDVIDVMGGFFPSHKEPADGI